MSVIIPAQPGFDIVIGERNFEGDTVFRIGAPIIAWKIDGGRVFVITHKRVYDRMKKAPGGACITDEPTAISYPDGRVYSNLKKRLFGSLDAFRQDITPPSPTDDKRPSGT